MSNSETPFIFAIVRGYENAQEVWINTKECWEERGHLTDCYSKAQHRLINEITTKARLCNLMESTYESATPISDKELHEKLLKSGLDFDPAFQKWAEKEVIEHNL